MFPLDSSLLQHSRSLSRSLLTEQIPVHLCLGPATLAPRGQGCSATSIGSLTRGSAHQKPQEFRVPEQGEVLVVDLHLGAAVLGQEDLVSLLRREGRGTWQRKDEKEARRVGQLEGGRGRANREEALAPEVALIRQGLLLSSKGCFDPAGVALIRQGLL